MNHIQITEQHWIYLILVTPAAMGIAIALVNVAAALLRKGILLASVSWNG